MGGIVAIAGISNSAKKPPWGVSQHHSHPRGFHSTGETSHFTRAAFTKDMHIAFIFFKLALISLIFLIKRPCASGDEWPQEFMLKPKVILIENDL